MDDRFPGSIGYAEQITVIDKEEEVNQGQEEEKVRKELYRHGLVHCQGDYVLVIAACSFSATNV